MTFSDTYIAVLTTLVCVLFLGNIYWWIRLNKLSKQVSNAIREKHRFLILLVRHGESEGNINPAVYKDVPDSKIQLTKKGQEMSQIAGQHIKSFIEKEFPTTKPRVTMWLSPFVRTRETANEIIQVLGPEKVSSIRESPLLVEQDWGLFEGTGMDEAPKRFPIEAERCETMKRHQGKFWARFPLGESCFDVCQRVQILFASIMRDRFGTSERKQTDIVIVVSHGITIRAFVMMWCHFTPEWFDSSKNPPNCSIRLIDSESPTRDAGYLFGGWDKGASISNPTSVEHLHNSEKNIPAPYSVLRAKAFLLRHSTSSISIGTPDKHDPTSSTPRRHIKAPLSPSFVFRRVSGSTFDIVEMEYLCSKCSFREVRAHQTNPIDQPRCPVCFAMLLPRGISPHKSTSSNSLPNIASRARHSVRSFSMWSGPSRPLAASVDVAGL
eukprot:c15265_g1_i1.p1 GENE.c15265_g1_i1~~c15265_g1_i1.p1  ORF type:complete len:438 (+),score=63.96 c15265_g1_i1:166-1479(+)